MYKIMGHEMFFIHKFSCSILHLMKTELGKIPNAAIVLFFVFLQVTDHEQVRLFPSNNKWNGHSIFVNRQSIRDQARKSKIVLRRMQCDRGVGEINGVFSPA